ncbi:MAG: DNA integrity scanning protein DisA nucleotide-binding domain protein [Gemmataceae bacterium]|nr:DNA integrity scanning protein DisA nucleotide-binding domain protein [Gemmataceae bacterium]
MLQRLAQLYESVGTRDLVQIGILALVVFALLRFLHRTGTGSTIGRGLGLVVVALFLLAQVIVASLDLTELGTVLDYLLFALLLILAVLFQPELRRGLMMLGRTKLWQGWVPTRHAVADPLADAAEALSRDGIGALIVIQREVSLAPYIETGQAIDGKLSAPLIRTVFTPRSPLHDGAIILVKGRVVAAGCQLPMRNYDHLADARILQRFGMRHRAALCLSEETDAIVMVISEETGRISLACGGRFEPVPRGNLARRLVALLCAAPAKQASMPLAA